MKQGQASSSGPADRKIEPRPTAINPGAVSRMGAIVGNHAENHDIRNPNFVGMNIGRGYSAPGIGTTTHPSGSQGKHK